jgi:hypothetical protein
MQVGTKLKDKIVAPLVTQVSTWLRPGEEILLVCRTASVKPMLTQVVMTNQRLTAVGTSPGAGPVVDLRLEAIQSMESKTGLTKRVVVKLTGSEEVSIGAVGAEDLDTIKQLLATVDLGALAASGGGAAASAGSAEIATALSKGQLPGVTTVGNISNKAARSIIQSSHGGVHPWFVLGAGSGGVLAAWEDRIAIIKTGALTSLMAGALGGERATTFYLRDINALEFNSGMVSGVLEVLTASYSGQGQKDFWKGTNKGRNANANDPFTESNTLPLSKLEYNAAIAQINELRKRISEAKQGPAVTAPPPAAASLSNELARLAELHQTGVLDEAEFKAAKSRLLARDG